MKSDSAIYFTDRGPARPPQQWDLTFSGVYRLSPDLGTLSLLVGDFTLPNGLAFSPDKGCSTSTTRAVAISALST